MGSRLKYVFAVSLLLQFLGVAYGRNRRTLNSIKNTDIEITVGVHNSDLSTLHSQPNNSVFPGKRSNPNGSSWGSSWCIASLQAQQSDLQRSLDWVCGPGQADCSAIQPGQRCFEPDELYSHASFAFNNYYRNHGATGAACDFGGTSTLVYTDPSYGKCIYD